MTLTKDEAEILRSQIVTSKEANRGGSRYQPYVFTELGVAMLSSVLKSPQAITVNINVMRAFVALRQYAALYAELKAEVSQLQQKYDGQFADIFNALDYLMNPPAQRIPIGFGQTQSEV